MGQSNDGGLLHRAEEEIRRALKDDQNSGQAHSALGVVHFYRGRMELARDELHLARKLNPMDLNAVAWMICYYQLRGSNQAGQAQARALIGREPLFFPARMNLADLLRERGDTAQAIRELDKILEVDPQNQYAVLCKARVYMDAGELTKARLVLERARPDDRRGYQFTAGARSLEFSFGAGRESSPASKPNSKDLAPVHDLAAARPAASQIE